MAMARVEMGGIDAEGMVQIEVRLDPRSGQWFVNDKQVSEEDARMAIAEALPKLSPIQLNPPREFVPDRRRRIIGWGRRRGS